MISMDAHGNIEEIRIVIFRVSDIYFGVDMEQVLQIQPLDRLLQKDLELVWIHERIDFNHRTIDYAEPLVLEIERQNTPSGIVIEELEDIDVSVPLDRIHPLPTLLEVHMDSSPIWGVTLQNSSFVFLIDAYRFLSAADIEQ